jgi:hypothetical protein
MASHQAQADLVKIGYEGFAIIDKYYGRPRRPGRFYYAPPYPYTSQVPEVKEPSNNTNVPSSNNTAGKTFRGIYSEVKFF